MLRIFKYFSEQSRLFEGKERELNEGIKWSLFLIFEREMHC